MAEQTPNSSANTFIENQTDPAHLAYLMSQIGKIHSPRGQYPRPKIRPQPQRPAHNLTAAQKLAYEFMKSWSHDFTEGFTQEELKKTFRQTAIRLHPDQGGTPAQFIELKAHYETLKQVFQK